MRYIILFTCCLLGIALILGILVFFRPFSKTATLDVVDYQKYIVAIAYATRDGDRVYNGYAVVAGEDAGQLYLLTAKHVVEDPGKQYVVTFSNGTQRFAKEIRFPLKNEDIALLSVSLEGLKRDGEYAIPELMASVDIPEGASAYIYMDEYYGVDERKIVSCEAQGTSRGRVWYNRRKSAQARNRHRLIPTKQH